jgi:predicted esterase
MLAIHVPSYYPREIQELTGIPLSRLGEVPSWQIHGAGDAIVPVKLARRLVEDFARAGVKVRFTELSDHEHDVWSETFADPEFYQWFLPHEKK